MDDFLKDFLSAGDELVIDLSQHPEPERSDTVDWDGVDVRREDVEEVLGEAAPEGRVIGLTHHQRYSVVKRLDELAGDMELGDGKSLYQEYREMINYEFSNHEDFDEAFWISSDYLQALAKNKRTINFWEEL